MRFASFVALAAVAAGLVASGVAYAVLRDEVIGKGEITGCISPGPCTLPNATFSVDTSTKLKKPGPKITGTYRFRGLVGAVTCQNVNGNVASVGGIITKSSNSQIINHPFVVFFVDNGPPVNGVSPDLASRPDVDPGSEVTLPPGFPATCPSPVASIPYYALLAGDIVVRDQTP